MILVYSEMTSAWHCDRLQKTPRYGAMELRQHRSISVLLCLSDSRLRLTSKLRKAEKLPKLLQNTDY